MESILEAKPESMVTQSRAIHAWHITRPLTNAYKKNATKFFCLISLADIFCFFFLQFLQFSVNESRCFRYTFARERVCTRLEFEDSFPVYVFFTKQNLADFALAVLVYTKPIIPLSVGA